MTVIGLVVIWFTCIKKSRRKVMYLFCTFLNGHPVHMMPKDIILGIPVGNSTEVNVTPEASTTYDSSCKNWPIYFPIFRESRQIGSFIHKLGLYCSLL